MAVRTLSSGRDDHEDSVILVTTSTTVGPSRQRNDTLRDTAASSGLSTQWSNITSRKWHISFAVRIFSGSERLPSLGRGRRLEV